MSRKSESSNYRSDESLHFQICKPVICENIHVISEDPIKRFHIYDVFVICDDDDEFTLNTLLPKMQETKISYCCSARDFTPGRRLVDEFRIFFQGSRKTLICLSNQLMRNDELTYNIDCLIKSTKNVITLVTDGQIKEEMSYLKNATVIYLHSLNWWEKLSTDIKIASPDFCQILYTGRISDSLILRGLSFQSFTFDLYGLLIVAEEKIMRFDMSRYSKHLLFHRKYAIEKVCGKCNFLRSPDTMISLAYGSAFLEENTIANDELAEGIVQLCKNLMDVRSFTNVWVVGCSVKGNFSPSHQKCTAELLHRIRYEIYNETTKNVTKPFFPKYEDIEERKTSFKSSWPEIFPTANLMAEAGFYLMAKPNRAQCFYCGFNRSQWKEEEDPLLLHATYIKTCGYLQSKIKDKKIPPYRKVSWCTRNDVFKSNNARIGSFDSFEVSKILHSTKHTTEKLARAGFYYSGNGTFVNCFSCGLVTSYSSAKMDPWVLHAMQSPQCSFLHTEKGDDFFETVESTMNIFGENEPTVITFLLKQLNGIHREDWKDHICIEMPFSASDQD